MQYNKLIKASLAVMTALSIAGCTKPAAPVQGTDTTAETTETPELQAFKVWTGETVQNGSIVSALPSEEMAWKLDEAETNESQVTYRDADKFIRFRFNDEHANAGELHTAMKDEMEASKTAYTSDEIDINGLHYFVVRPEGDDIRLTTDLMDGHILVVECSKDIDFTDEELVDILSSIAFAEGRAEADPAKADEEAETPVETVEEAEPQAESSEETENN